MLGSKLPFKYIIDSAHQPVKVKKHIVHSDESEFDIDDLVPNDPDFEKLSKLKFNNLVKARSLINRI